MNLEPPAPRSHPFGRGANFLVLAGTSLSLIQSLVVALGAFAAPIEADFEVTGLRLLLWLVAGVGLPTLVGWTAWRALRSWWRRSARVVGQLLLAGLVALPASLLLTMPVGDEPLVPLGYLPAGILILAGALMARGRIERAQRAGGEGVSER